MSLPIEELEAIMDRTGGSNTNEDANNALKQKLENLRRREAEILRGVTPADDEVIRQRLLQRFRDMGHAQD